MGSSIMLSNCYLAALASHVRWLPCPAAVGSDYKDLPALLAVWSQETQQHFLTVGGARQDAQSQQLQRLAPGLLPPVKHPGVVTDLQVAAVQDDIVAATSSSNGSVCVLVLRLPPTPGATLEDLQYVQYDDGDDADEDADMASEEQQQNNSGAAGRGPALHELTDLHESAVASVDINTTRQCILSVAGDGSIAVVPLDSLAQAGGDSSSFKGPSSWSGFSQGRWVDSQTFATAGQLGGLQVWDVRAGPRPAASSDPAWGHTGCGQLDRQQGAARQLLCLDVHPSRPNLAATGSSGGCVALWDLRLAAAPLSLSGSSTSSSGSSAPAGDVWEVRFDPCDAVPSAAAALPPLLYCTADGALCRASAAAAGRTAGRHGGSSRSTDATGSGGGSSGQQLVCEVLAGVECSINSFDVEPSVGSDVLAVTDFERMLLLHRPECAA